MTSLGGVLVGCFGERTDGGKVTRSGGGLTRSRGVLDGLSVLEVVVGEALMEGA